jgi:hypothetical protein
MMLGTFLNQHISAASLFEDLCRGLIANGMKRESVPRLAVSMNLISRSLCSILILNMNHTGPRDLGSVSSD